MSDTIIAALIGAAGTIIGALIGVIAKFVINRGRAEGALTPPSESSFLGRNTLLLVMALIGLAIGLALPYVLPDSFGTTEISTQEPGAHLTTPSTESIDNILSKNANQLVGVWEGDTTSSIGGTLHIRVDVFRECSVVGAVCASFDLRSGMCTGQWELTEVKNGTRFLFRSKNATCPIPEEDSLELLPDGTVRYTSVFSEGLNTGILQKSEK